MRHTPRGSASPDSARVGLTSWGSRASRSPPAKRSRKLLDRKPFKPADTTMSGTSSGRVSSEARSLSVCLPQLSMKMRGQGAFGGRDSRRFSSAMPMGALSGHGRLKNRRRPGESGFQPSQKSGVMPGAGRSAAAWSASAKSGADRPETDSSEAMDRNGAAEARNSASVAAAMPSSASTPRAAGWAARNRVTGRARSGSWGMVTSPGKNAGNRPRAGSRAGRRAWRRPAPGRPGTRVPRGWFR